MINQIIKLPRKISQDEIQKHLNKIFVKFGIEPVMEALFR